MEAEAEAEYFVNLLNLQDIELDFASFDAGTDQAYIASREQFAVFLV